MKKLLLLLLLSLGLNAMAEEICYGREDNYGFPSELFNYCDVGDVFYLKDFDWNDSLATVIATYCDLSETQIVYGISSSSAQLVCRLVKARKIKR